MRRWSKLIQVFRAVENSVADRELLDRHLKGDAAAFELLMRRHADLVWGVCQRICRHEHDAEDAFQATFLVLHRKAATITTNLAGWLHRTAYRVALRAWQRKSKRREIELVEPAIAIPEAPNIDVDAAIDRLPEKYRLPIIMAYIERQNTEAIAVALGIPRGTVLSRLSKARSLLQARLNREQAQWAAALTTLSAPSALVVHAGSTSNASTILASEVLAMAFWKSMTKFCAATLVLTVGTGVGVMMAQSGNGGPTPGTNPAPAVAKPIMAFEDFKPVKDIEDLTLLQKSRPAKMDGPPALNKLKLERWDLAQEHLQLNMKFFVAGSWDAVQLPNYYLSAKMCRDAGLDCVPNQPEAQQKLLNDYMQFTDYFETVFKVKFETGALRKSDYVLSKLMRTEAELDVEKFRERQRAR